MSEIYTRIHEIMKSENDLRASVTLSFASVGVACMDCVTSAGSAFGDVCGQSAC